MSRSRPRTLLSLLLGIALLAGTLLPAALLQAAVATAATEAHPDLQAPAELQALAAEYRALGSYRDEGMIEITTFEDSAEHTVRVSFATRVTPAGFQMELWPETGSQSVLWTRSRAGRNAPVFRYDARAKQFALYPSLWDALPRSFGPAVWNALQVPRWLLGETPTGLLDEPGSSDEPTVETGQPCEEGAPGSSEPDSPCRVLTWTSPPERFPDKRLRLWLGEDGRVRRVEVERGPEPYSATSETQDDPQAGFAPSQEWTLVEVVHTPRDPEPDALPFVPPPDAQRVARLPEPVRAGGSPGKGDGARASGTFSESIQVSEVLLPVQVIDREGNPLPGLTAEDFRLRVDGQEVPIQAATWRDPRDPWIAEVEGMSEDERREAGVDHVAAGRLVVLFFQTDFNAIRIKGHMAFLPKIRDLLAALAPTDRVALVTYDSHLKLWHDFTTDRQAILDLVKDAFRFGADPGPVRPGNVRESLTESFDFAAAKDAAFVEEGLAVVARAMEPFVADKVLLFVGWGVGHNGTQAFRDGYRALSDAKVTMHALDVTYVDGVGPAHGGHTLAAPLSAMAQTTGGTYVATHVFPDFAVQTVALALQGHYELSVRESDLPPAGGRIQIELRDSKKGDKKGEIYNPGGVPYLGPAAAAKKGG